MWWDGIGILRAGDFPPGYPGWVTASVLICNTFFTALQLWWTKLLFAGGAARPSTFHLDLRMPVSRSDTRPLFTST